jgi:2,3-bisphosphoglycerate-dependent phosphoglycerate mutase
MYRKYLRNKNTKRLLVIRHRQSIWNNDSKFTGWTNIPLTEKGKDKAKQIAKSLLSHYYRPNIIFSFILDRAIQTSNIIKKELNYKNIHIHT